MTISEQVVCGKLRPSDLDGARQTRRARAEQILRAPEPQRGILDDQHERECREQMEQFGRLVDAPQQHHLDQRAEHADHERRQHSAGQKPTPVRRSGSTSV